MSIFQCKRYKIRLSMNRKRSPGSRPSSYNSICPSRNRNSSSCDDEYRGIIIRRSNGAGDSVLVCAIDADCKVSITRRGLRCVDRKNRKDVRLLIECKVLCCARNINKRCRSGACACRARPCRGNFKIIFCRKFHSKENRRCCGPGARCDRVSSFNCLSPTGLRKRPSYDSDGTNVIRPTHRSFCFRLISTQADSFGK